MAQSKEQKKKIVDKLKKNIDEQKSMVFVAIDSLKTKELSDFRKRLKEKECLVAVVKKTLMGLAFKAKKIEIEKDKLKGELALVFGFGDEISPAKISYKFSSENKNLKILGGYFENRFMGKEETVALAQIPSREELYQKVVGSIFAPVSSFVNVLQGNIRNLVYVLNAIKK
jgi:large subunit ribosomal protein L10